MNLFQYYQKKIFICLKSLEKRKLIKIPTEFKNFTIELPPKNQKADLSCNVAMILAKNNNNSPLNLAAILKNHLLSNIDEFKTIDVAGPGFLNISLHISFWKKYLKEIIKMNNKFGSYKNFKKKFIIKFYRI